MIKEKKVKGFFYCECEGDKCILQAEMSVEEKKKIREERKIIIVDGCETGASCRYFLSEERKGYSVYKRL